MGIRSFNRPVLGEQGIGAPSSLSTGSTGVTLIPYGLSVIGSTGAGSHTITAPRYAGVHKAIHCVNAGSSTGTLQVDVFSATNASVTIRHDGNTTYNRIRIESTAALELIAESTSRWCVMNQVGTITIARAT